RQRSDLKQLKEKQHQWIISFSGSSSASWRACSPKWSFPAKDREASWATSSSASSALSWAAGCSIPFWGIATADGSAVRSSPSWERSSCCWWCALSREDGPDNGQPRLLRTRSECAGGKQERES